MSQVQEDDQKEWTYILIRNCLNELIGLNNEHLIIYVNDLINYWCNLNTSMHVRSMVNKLFLV
jgi:hypothetical protein